MGQGRVWRCAYGPGRGRVPCAASLALRDSNIVPRRHSTKSNALNERSSGPAGVATRGSLLGLVVKCEWWGGREPAEANTAELPRAQ